jgi:hypothetical protein
MLILLTACLVNEDLYALRRIALRDRDDDHKAPDRLTGAPESCDGEDDNCNGTVDEEGTDRARYFDTLFDSSVFPGADQRGNGVEEDCDGSVDEDPSTPILGTYTATAMSIPRSKAASRWGMCRRWQRLRRQPRREPRMERRTG